MFKIERQRVATISVEIPATNDEGFFDQFPVFTFTDLDENLIPTKMELDISHDATAIELFRISTIVNLIMNTEVCNKISFYAFIKRYQLERHFKISHI